MAVLFSPGHQAVEYIKSCWVSDLITVTAKLTSPQNLADERLVGLLKLLCITMFDISKIRPKSILGPVKGQKFSGFLTTLVSTMEIISELYNFI